LSAIAASAVGAGIEPAEGALTVRPVYQHTSPTRRKRAPLDSGAASAVRGRPPRARLARRHAASNCQRSRAHVRRVGSGSWTRTNIQGVRDPGPAVRRSRSALAGNRTLTGGLRTRCSANELQAQIPWPASGGARYARHCAPSSERRAHTTSESGENRTLTAQGKNLARCRYATDSLSANLMFNVECHSNTPLADGERRSSSPETRKAASVTRAAFTEISGKRAR
jgi:hypothetical protein